MKGLILAAGSGNRMKPLTETLEKSMLPICNKPLIEHTIEAFAGAGITELFIVVNPTSPLPGHFKEWLGDWQNVEIEVEENN